MNIKIFDINFDDRATFKKANRTFEYILEKYHILPHIGDFIRADDGDWIGIIETIEWDSNEIIIGVHVQ
jgi:hypothetical protein